jgi:hypothetical protein
VVPKGLRYVESNFELCDHPAFKLLHRGRRRWQLLKALIPRRTRQVVPLRRPQGDDRFSQIWENPQTLEAVTANSRCSAMIPLPGSKSEMLWLSCVPVLSFALKVAPASLVCRRRQRHGFYFGVHRRVAHSIAPEAVTGDYRRADL